MQFKPIQFIHLAFCGSILLFSIVAVLITDAAGFTFPIQKDDPLQLIAPLLAVFGIFVGNQIFRSRVAAIDPEQNAAAKFMQYQSIFLIRSAMIEGPALFNVVVFILTKNIFFLLVSSICLIAMWLARPTRYRISSSLGIAESELN